MIIEINGISITVEKKKIKNIYLRVHAPDGAVKVTAPRWASDKEIRSFVESRLDWIMRVRQKYTDYVNYRKPEYLSGETHYLWGVPYRLEVLQTDSRKNVTVEADRIILQVPEHFTADQREKVMLEWYREQLKEAVPEVMKKCIMKVRRTPSEWRIKNMRTRWGTCNVVDKRIWLNLQLAKKPPECLEYVITHELVHLYERNHSRKFWGYMDKFYPNWREVRKKLNAAEADGSICEEG